MEAVLPVLLVVLQQRQVLLCNRCVCVTRITMATPQLAVRVPRVLAVVPPRPV